MAATAGASTRTWKTPVGTPSSSSPIHGWSTCGSISATRSRTKYSRRKCALSTAARSRPGSRTPPRPRLSGNEHYSAVLQDLVVELDRSRLADGEPVGPQHDRELEQAA